MSQVYKLVFVGAMTGAGWVCFETYRHNTQLQRFQTATDKIMAFAGALSAYSQDKERANFMTAVNRCSQHIMRATDLREQEGYLSGHRQFEKQLQCLEMIAQAPEKFVD